MVVPRPLPGQFAPLCPGVYPAPAGCGEQRPGMASLSTDLPGSPPCYRGGGMDRVLLLESSATRRRAVRSLLTPKGYDVTEASDYAQALEILRRQGETINALRAIVLGWPEFADNL